MTNDRPFGRTFGARKLTLTAILVCLALVTAGSLMAEEVEVSSLEELALYAGNSGNIVRMEPGTYEMTDYISLDDIPERRREEKWQYIDFTGSNNEFDLAGVTIRFDTRLGNKLRAPIHTPDFLISGDGNVLKGLSITYVGNHPSRSENVLSVRGENNTLRKVTLRVRGSYPYGYGDLFGKGGGGLVGPRKHSGLRIKGPNTRVIGCEVYMRSFGHGFYVQGDGENAYFKDCYVEGKMRSTDDILAEEDGLARELEYRMVYRNREGEKKILPGYMKSVAEDGFRTYGVDNLTFINCTSKNMRGAFELRSSGHHLQNCTVLGNERGYWIGSNSIVENCEGDAKYGPLMFIEGKNIDVDVELLARESGKQVHSLGTIHGRNNNIKITPASDERRERPVPILLGFSQPGGGEGMSSYGRRQATDIRLVNRTRMPVKLGKKTKGCEVMTRGDVVRSAGEGNSIERLGRDSP